MYHKHGPSRATDGFWGQIFKGWKYIDRWHVTHDTWHQTHDTWQLFFFFPFCPFWYQCYYPNTSRSLVSTLSMLDFNPWKLQNGLPHCLCEEIWPYVCGLSSLAVQCSAVQCSAVQCRAVHCSSVPCSAVQFNADIWVQWSSVQCSAMQCSEVNCSAVKCSAVQCSAVQYSVKVRKGTASYGIWPTDLQNTGEYHSGLYSGRCTLYIL